MTEKITLTISGMHCSSCAKIIETSLEEKEGVGSIFVNYDSKKAFLEFDSEKINLDELKSEIESLGYSIAAD
ncbi:MAG: heavy-metal-associated domain-containing protein [Candidatus Staskawiczbacteria bacterium]|nr:heavy-metal-associated domain-containing protein [Candidatus Staskawiczbacteria bacterium]